LRGDAIARKDFTQQTAQNARIALFSDLQFSEMVLSAGPYSNFSQGCRRYPLIER
jgi:hypothetical protein